MVGVIIRVFGGLESIGGREMVQKVGRVQNVIYRHTYLLRTIGRYRGREYIPFGCSPSPSPSVRDNLDYYYDLLPHCQHELA